MSLFTVTRRNSKFFEKKESLGKEGMKYDIDNKKLISTSNYVYEDVKTVHYNELKPVIFLLTLFGNHHFSYKSDTILLIKAITLTICIFKLGYHLQSLIMDMLSLILYGPGEAFGAELTSYTYTLKMIINSGLLIYIFYWNNGFIKFLKLWAEVRENSEKDTYSKLRKEVIFISLCMVMMMIILLSATFYYMYEDR